MIDGDKHALYVGWVHGMAMKHGVPVQNEMDAEGNYTDRLAVTLAEDWTLVLVVPPPPDDWTMG